MKIQRKGGKGGGVSRSVKFEGACSFQGVRVIQRSACNACNSNECRGMSAHEPCRHPHMAEVNSSRSSPS